MSITATTLDDLLRRVFEKILKDGSRVAPTRGANRELFCVLLTLTNPLARFSHTEKRGRVFSALGEFAWYLSGSNSSKFVSYYIERYKKETERDGTIHGAYGPRIFSPTGLRQFDTVIELLNGNASSRKAVIQLFDAEDLLGNYKDVLCTCTLQLLLRSNRLHMSVSMRSNDAYFGLPHDVFSFTMIQELAVRSLGCELGTYSHYAGSLHIYDEHVEGAKNFLNEGWQDRELAAMPPMPAGDPRPWVQDWLSAEASIRNGRRPARRLVEGLGDYWGDLLRLLQVFSCSKRKKKGDIAVIKAAMKCPVYKEYISQKAKPKKTAPKAGQLELFPTEDTASNGDLS